MFETSMIKLAGVILVCGFLVGCGDAQETVEGDLHYNGAPLALKGDDEANIVFVHEQGKGSYSANLNKENKSFTLTPAGKEPMVPGTYKVVVSITSYGNSTDVNGKELDKLQGAFSIARTPLKYEVAPGERQKIVVDLAKGTVVKQ